MTILAEKTKIVNFRAEPTLAEEAKVIAAEHGTSLGKILQLFLKNMVATGKVDLLSEEELEKERLFKDLQAEVMKNVNEMNAGNYMSLDELEEKLFG